jgi:hypothetical protein
MSITINGSTGISGVDGDATTPAIRGADSDTGISFGTNEVKINTNGSGRVTVDANGNVGIGTSSISTFGGYTTLEINNGTNGAILDLSQGDVMRGRFVAVSSSATIETSGSIPILFSPGGSERARVTTNGLTFNGDTAAANALDDYEEGTWTVTVLGTISNPTVNIGYQMNRYVKVGGVVHFYSNFQGTMSGGSGAFYIAGLPYTPQNTNWMPVALAYTNVNGTAAPCAAMVQANTQTVYFWTASGADARSNVNTQVSIANIGTYFDIYIGGSYMTF